MFLILQETDDADRFWIFDNSNSRQVEQIIDNLCSVENMNCLKIFLSEGGSNFLPVAVTLEEEKKLFLKL